MEIGPIGNTRALGPCIGRPLGLLALWLQRSHPDHASCCLDKHTHQGIAATLSGTAFFDARKAARVALWASRVDHPTIVELFEVEARVPAGLLAGIEPQLWEPEHLHDTMMNMC